MESLTSLKRIFKNNKCLKSDQKGEGEKGKGEGGGL